MVIQVLKKSLWRLLLDNVLSLTLINITKHLHVTPTPSLRNIILMINALKVKQIKMLAHQQVLHVKLFQLIFLEVMVLYNGSLHLQLL